MAEYKLVISDPKTGKSLQKEVKDDDAKHFKGLKVGQTVKGELMDLPGYEFLITGGSDAAGFPMRRDVAGAGRSKILAVNTIGIENKKRKPNPKKKGWRTMKGMRRKKTVAGNTIYDKTAQINLKITKAGSQSLFEEAKPEAEAAPADAPKADAPAEEKKAEAPKEEKKEEPKPEVKEEKPKEEKKPEAKEEKKEESTKEKPKEDAELEEIEKKVKEDEKEIEKLDKAEKKVEEELKEIDSEEKKE